ncbi:LOW QUALITY PROTEIN: endonuclease-reverse transcriptase [Plakobranchus ocellatus]|uniref:Endonuclease-reverse transcriptase n=1 Tax=Plakobranchus ocellatus TaxID=259542 RepID=A0AAV3YFI0_9GAST|nr:LOW QUALITY PROTEIN: endonuclease-reverse transcriptase [Plakobranchus ocellatus]
MYSSDSTADQQEKLEETREDEEINLLPLRSEIEWAIGSLKDGRSPGCDDIQAEMIKACGEEGIDVYHKLCKKIWEKGQWPTDWKRAIFISLPKKGDLQLCSNYRTIALISHASKIIMKRMERKLEEEVSNSQA